MPKDKHGLGKEGTGRNCLKGIGSSFEGWNCVAARQRWWLLNTVKIINATELLPLKWLISCCMNLSSLTTTKKNFKEPESKGLERTRKSNTNVRNEPSSSLCHQHSSRCAERRCAEATRALSRWVRTRRPGLLQRARKASRRRWRPNAGPHFGFTSAQLAEPSAHCWQ